MRKLADLLQCAWVERGWYEPEINFYRLRYRGDMDAGVRSERQVLLVEHSERADAGGLRLFRFCSGKRSGVKRAAGAHNLPRRKNESDDHRHRAGGAPCKK